MQHLLNISIGPVQEFIASARRCQDLWYGSWLLSELAKACARGVLAHAAVTEDAIIFPGGASKKMLEASSESSIANKLLVIVDSADRDVADAVARAGWGSMMDRLAEIRRQTFARIEGDFDRQRAEAQIDEMIEIQWVAVLFESDGDYAKARKTSERHLAAVKNTKTWGQPTAWAEDGRRKSSLDGVRESVLDDDRLKALKGDPNRLYQLYRLRPSERLCGVGLLKRFGTEKEGRNPFHSTGHVAVGPLRERLAKLSEEKQQPLKRLWATYEQALAGVDAYRDETLALERAHPVFGKADAGLAFESRLDDHFPASKEDSGKKAALEALRAFLRAAECSTPNPYYALLLADGDRMGKAIDACETQGRHRAISKALDGFAQEVETIVKDHEGSLIYSGGDDVLALVPLHACLPCAWALKERFGKALSDYPTERGGREKPTLSVGLGISHFLDDMAESLELARRAEKLAKLERNSLAILWQKRGGGAALEACGKWDSGFFEELLEDIQTQMDSELSRKLPFELEALARLLDGAKGGDAPALLDVVKADARRILGRKRKSGGQEEVQENVMDSLLERIEEIKDAAGLRLIADQLQMAKEFARAYEQAGIPALTNLQNEEATA